MGESLKSALELSRYIIGLCTSEGEPISNLQLQKILYYIQKEFLTRGTEAFSDEFQAWQFGPVIPCVYRQYCAFGSRYISMLYSNKLETYTDAEKSLIDRIVHLKRKKYPWELVRETHQSGKAWSIIYNKYGNSNAIIPKDLIKKVG